MGEFGEKFRKERERRGLTLDDVSSVTKINSRMLKAIEGEHFDQLPGGVFNKGFVRAYAKHLGLNDEDAITEYLAVLREAQIGAQTAEWQPAQRPEHRIAIEPPRSGTSLPKSPSAERKSVEFATGHVVVEKPHVEPPVDTAPTPVQHEAPMFRAAPFTVPEREKNGLPWKTGLVVLTMVVIAAALWSRRSHDGRAGQPGPSRPNQETVQTARSPAMSSDAHPTPVDPKAGGTAAAGTPASPRGTLLPSAGPDSRLGVQSAVIGTRQSPGSGDDVAVRPLVNNHATGTAKAPVTFTLVIRATKTSWISVEADGQMVNQETLIAPAHTSARATREIVVKAGNAAGVSFLLNGKEFPAQGNEAEVKTYVFDSQGMRNLPSQATGTDR